MKYTIISAFRIVILFLGILFSHDTLFAQGVGANPVNNDLSPVSKYKVAVLEDDERGKGVNEIHYDSLESAVPNFGIHSGQCQLMFTVESSDDLNTSLYGYIDYPLLDTVRVYQIGFPSGDSVVSTEKKLITTSGESQPFVSRNSGVPGFMFPLGIVSNEQRTYLLEITSGEQIVVPLIVGPKDKLESKLFTRELIYSLYLGIIVVMIVYNLFIYFSVKDKVYIYYVLYILTVGLTQFVISGFANKYFWPTSGVFSVLASALVPIASGMATIGFTRNFIQTRKYAPFIDKLLVFYFCSYVLSAFFALTGNHFYSQNIINFNAASALILVPAAIKAIRGNYRPAKFFIVAWIIFIFGVTMYALRNFGVLPFNNLTNYALPIGSALETVLLSFALADRINTFKKEKEESQRQALLALEENARLVGEQNVMLEQMVHERTVDLERTNLELSDTVRDLKLTQKQLVESEKLASLGQMTAGIAHEINNPINFVQSNVPPLKRDVEDILGILESYAALESNDQMDENIKTLKKRYNDMDMDYVKKEVGQLLSGIEEGSRRTAEIVRGLRVFSRQDRDTLVNGNINECINSTLVVMKSMTKGHVTVIKELDDNMPSFNCYPGKLNQVLMNVITNAVQSTRGEGKQHTDRIIEIKSSFDDQNIIVSVEDNGTGIEESIRSKIFDPFFTTKAVGDGTGLGLSIVMGIVSEHQGHIDVHTELGKGSRFVITLPRQVNPVSQVAA